VHTLLPSRRRRSPQLPPAIRSLADRSSIGSSCSGSAVVRTVSVQTAQHECRRQGIRPLRRRAGAAMARRGYLHAFRAAAPTRTGKAQTTNRAVQSILTCGANNCRVGAWRPSSFPVRKRDLSLLATPAAGAEAGQRSETAWLGDARLAARLSSVAALRLRPGSGMDPAFHWPWC
jgi:hypothetical protein